MRFDTFDLERWQSHHEHHVEINLSESGVHPLTVAELFELSGGEDEADLLLRTRLGYPQTNGSEPLRSRIAEMYEGISEEQVLVTVGGAEANFVALWHLLEPGEPVAVLLPTYMQVPGLVTSLGGRVIPVPLVEDTGWEPDLDALARALEEGARFIHVTNPNNPTGAVLSEAAMDAIVSAAASSGAWILSDEVYRGAELDGRESPSFLGKYDRGVVTSSLSKAYGLPGLRLGWAVAPSEVAADLWARTDYTTIAPASLSDALATVALGPEVRPKLLQRTRSILRRNIPLLEAWAEELDDAVKLHPPRAGAIAYLRYFGDTNSSTLAERLRVEEDVLVVPGDHFGMDGHLRIGYGEPAEKLSEGLRRLGKVLRAIR